MTIKEVILQEKLLQINENMRFSFMVELFAKSIELQQFKLYLFLKDKNGLFEAMLRLITKRVLRKGSEYNEKIYAFILKPYFC